MNRFALVYAAAALFALVAGCGSGRPNQSAALLDTEPPLAYTQATINLASDADGRPFLADFSGDGKLDIAIQTSSTTVAVFLNNGNGTFQSPVATTIPDPMNAIQGMVVGDFNGDGKADLVLSISVSNGTTNNILLLGNGDGTFSSGPAIPNSQGFQLGQAVDLTGDHHLDLIQAINGVGLNPKGGLMVSLGNGDGTFAQSQFYPISGVVVFTGMIVADFNGDGHLDILLSNFDLDPNSYAALFFLAGTGSGTFQTPLALSNSTYFRQMTSVACADLFGQGQQDVVVAGRYLSVPAAFEDMLISGLDVSGDTTTFAGSALPASQTGDLVQIADLNADGRPDLITLNSAAGLLTLILNREIGETSPASGVYQFDVASGVAAGPTGIYPGNIAVGDLNGDGLPDVVVAPAPSSSISILLSQKP